MTTNSREAVRAFLNGEAPLDGVWFGDKHPTERGAYWWRKHLSALTGEPPVEGGALEGQAVAWAVTREGDSTFPRIYTRETDADDMVNYITLPPRPAKRPLVFGDSAQAAPPAQPSGEAQWLDVPAFLRRDVDQVPPSGETVTIPRHYVENIRAAAALLENTGDVFNKREAAVLRTIAANATPTPAAQPSDAESLLQRLEDLEAEWCAASAGRSSSRRISTYDVKRNTRGEDDFDNEVLARTRCASQLALLIARARATAPTPAAVGGDAVSADDVQWIVNDNAELGVMIHGRAFFLYKGDSLVYEDGKHDDGTPMHYRTVGKREFGECAYPINYKDPSMVGTVSLGDSDRWQPLPALTAEPPVEGGDLIERLRAEANDFAGPGTYDIARLLREAADALTAAGAAQGGGEAVCFIDQYDLAEKLALRGSATVGVKQLAGDVPLYTHPTPAAQPSDAVELRRLLALIYAAHENGDPCFDESGVFLGHAYRLSEEDENAIVAALSTPAAVGGDAGFGKVFVGNLTTMTQEDYPGLGDWWVQLRIGADNEVLARVYGESPQQARERAQTIRAAIAAEQGDGR